MSILVACECSGRVRDALIARGYDAMSCDLEPSEVPGPHYQGDVLDIINEGWSGMIAHPPCTRLANSGVRWLEERDLWNDLAVAAAFFCAIKDSHIPRIAIENPIPHIYAVELIGRKYDQKIQPWQFGHGETKATCLWLKGLPHLQPTNIVDGRDARIHLMPPGPDRTKERSRTYQGIAHAMADQWGALLAQCDRDWSETEGRRDSDRSAA